MANTARCLRELDGNPSLTYRSIAAVFNVHHHVPSDDLRILKRLRDRVHRSNADILVLKKLEPLVTCFLTEHFLDFLLRLLSGTIGQASKVMTTEGMMLPMAKARGFMGKPSE